MGIQPSYYAHHLFVRLSSPVLQILFAPALNLTSTVLPGAATMIRETHFCRVYAMEPGHRLANLFVYLGPFRYRQAWQRRITEDSPFYILHEIEGGAYDAIIRAKAKHFRYRHPRAPQRLLNSILSFDVVCRLQQLAVRFLAQYPLGQSTPSRVVPWGMESLDQERGIGLSSLELAGSQSVQAFGQPR
eukprot:scaffold2889_cov407-Prasinococcus_capsulatus_cf.AAC.8